MRGMACCWAPKVPGFTPVGSRLEVRQRMATGVSDWNRSAPEEPTGRLRSVLSTPTTSRSLPAGTVTVVCCGEALLFPAAWNLTVTLASRDDGLYSRASVRQKVPRAPPALDTPLTTTFCRPPGRSSNGKSDPSPVTLSATDAYPAARPLVSLHH